MKRQSNGELTFKLQCKLFKLNKPSEEYKFDEHRKWRFDFAWPKKMIAVEIEGGVWTGGRHTRPTGFRNDCEKYNSATEQGWRIFRYTTEQINELEAIKQIKKVLNNNKLFSSTPDKHTDQKVDD